MLARACVALVAVVMLAWLGVMERDARLQKRGVRAAEARMVASAEADFRAARLLNPDTTPDVSRAFLYAGSGRRQAAAALLDDVVRREPDNLVAWRLLYEFTRERDADAAGRASAAMRRLDPLNAARRARSGPR